MDPSKIILHYRGVYILNRDFNLTFGSICIPCLKLMIIFSFILSLFAVVRLRKDLDVLSFAMSSAVSVTCACFILPMSAIMSSFYDVSCEFKQNMLPILEKISNRRVRKYAEGQLKSCPLIRCQIGSLYHMEAKAKLTLLQHVVNGFVFLTVNVHTKWSDFRFNQLLAATRSTFEFKGIPASINVDLNILRQCCADFR